jgi:hypothetical protein
MTPNPIVDGTEGLVFLVAALVGLPALSVILLHARRPHKTLPILVGGLAVSLTYLLKYPRLLGVAAWDTAINALLVGLIATLPATMLIVAVNLRHAKATGGFPRAMLIRAAIGWLAGVLALWLALELIGQVPALNRTTFDIAAGRPA